MKIQCNCGYEDEYDSDEIIGNLIICHSCLKAIPIPDDVPLQGVLKVFEVGDIVTITNKEHVWNGEIGIVKDKKLGFCRIEILGHLLWIHNDWIKINECLEHD